MQNWMSTQAQFDVSLLRTIATLLNLTRSKGAILFNEINLDNQNQKLTRECKQTVYIT